MIFKNYATGTLFLLSLLSATMSNAVFATNPNNEEVSQPVNGDFDDDNNSNTNIKVNFLRGSKKENDGENVVVRDLVQVDLDTIDPLDPLDEVNAENYQVELFPTQSPSVAPSTSPTCSDMEIRIPTDKTLRFKVDDTGNKHNGKYVRMAKQTDMQFRYRLHVENGTGKSGGREFEIRKEVIKDNGYQSIKIYNRKRDKWWARDTVIKSNFVDSENKYSYIIRGKSHDENGSRFVLIGNTCTNSNKFVLKSTHGNGSTYIKVSDEGDLLTKNYQHDATYFTYEIV